MKPKPPPAAAPVIETPRLVLRGFTAEDLAGFCALWNDPAVFQFITGQPLSREDHWSRLLKLVGHWQLIGFGSWAVTDRNTGALLGQCGFNDYRREMPLPMPEPEIGWVLCGAVHGKGLGFEATFAAQEWFDQNVSAPRTACIIDPANMPSRKLAAKLGYEPVAETTYKGKPTLLFHRQHGVTSPRERIQPSGGAPF